MRNKIRIKNLIYHRVNAQDYDVNGCIRLIGATVKVAIQDATNSPITSSKEHDRVDAMRFLFGHNVLENFFQTYHLDRRVNCGMIRDEAREIIAGRKELSDAIDPIEPTETEDEND